MEIANHLGTRDVKSLIQTNARLARELTEPVLFKHATKPENARCALFWAAANGNEEMVRYVLEKGSDIVVFGGNTHDAPGLPLYGKPDEAVVQFVLAQGANLVLGVASGRPGIVAEPNPSLRVMWSRRDIASGVDCGAIHALHWAVQHKREWYVGGLLKKGADVDAQEYRKSCTPLQMAVLYEEEEIVRILLESGAAVHHRSEGGETALHMAAQEQNYEIVRMLLENGAEVATNGWYCGTALDYFSIKFDYQLSSSLASAHIPRIEKLRTLFSEYGWDRETILHHASLMDYPFLVNHLLMDEIKIRRRSTGRP